MKFKMHCWLICVIVCTTSCIARAQSTRPFLTGFDANYSLEMEKAGKTWSMGETPADLFSILRTAGADSFRVRLWTGDDGAHGLHYATEVAKRAQATGLKPYLVIFLSDDWSDYIKQPAPKIWKDLDPPAKLAAIEAYAERVTKHFADAGVKIDLYEIGNEIDFGICGEFEEEWPHRVSLDYMRINRWPKMAPIIAAAQKGVKKANPKAKFMLHLTQWANTDYTIALWQAMIASSVQLDYAGLSYFPTWPGKAEDRPLAVLQAKVDAIAAAVKRPVIICETGYPSAANFPGQFSDWNKPIAGYTLDPAGQAKWITDLFAGARANPNFAGVFYWSPEWFDSSMWSEFALFDAKGQAKPALKSIAPKPAATQSSRPLNIYFGNLHSHTGYSDGTGTPEQAYAMARDEGKLDFLAITEHNHLMGGDKATPEKRHELYAGPPESALIPTANKFNVDGKFVALYGQEFSSMSKGNHVNVFDVPAVIDVPNGSFDNLLKWMDQHRDSAGQPGVMQFNHPGLDQRIKPKLMYGRDDFRDDAGWLANMGRATSLIEILNGEPLKEGDPPRAPQVMEEDYRKYLNLGFHLAPVGNQDNHKINWGTATEVRTAILAPELTRTALLAAMRARHVYATEDKNLQLRFTINGQQPGDIVEAKSPVGFLKITYDITDSDEPQASCTIDVFRGTVGKGLANVVQTVLLPKGPAAGSKRIDGVEIDADRQYVFFRVTQTSDAGVDRAWTAPVWFESPPATTQVAPGNGR